MSGGAAAALPRRAAPERAEAECGHCGLPAGRAAPPAFCCVGCRLAYAVSDGRGEAAVVEARLLVSAFLAMGVMTFSMVLYDDAVYGLATGAEALRIRRFGQIVLAALSLPILLLLGMPILRGAVADARALRFRMDGLIVLAVSAAFVLSLLHTATGSGPLYYETGVAVLLLITLGRRLEARVRARGRNSATLLLEALPATARRMAAGGGYEEVPARELVAGDRIEVLPGAGVPADLLVTAGRSGIRAAHLTGEEAPRTAGRGEQVPAGAWNLEGRLEGTVLATPAEGSLRSVLALLDAPLPPTRFFRTVDRLAGHLTLFAVGAALVGGVLAARREGETALVRTVLATLLVACPCALGLAIPLAYRAIRAALARSGFLVHDPVALELLPRVSHVLLDKTGTLTDPDSLRWVERRGGAQDLQRLDDLVRASGHALSRAVAHPAAELPAELRVEPGLGVQGHFGDQPWRAGRPEWFREEGWRWAPGLAAASLAMRSRGLALVAAGTGGVVRALAGAAQERRAGLDALGSGLRARGLEVALLSGDHEEAVQRVASELGLQGRGGLRPEGKVARIEALRAQGALTLMVGDGMNDAPALRAADVGLAVAQGTAATRSEAQIELAGENLHRLGLLFDAAHALRRTVRGNLAWTCIYNGGAVLLAAAGRLHPLVAVAAMILSSLAVSARSYRLLDFQGPSR
jgi:heavy metal translocating P-type ATPase